MGAATPGERITLLQNAPGSELTFWERATTTGFGGEHPRRSVRAGMLHLGATASPAWLRKAAIEVALDLAGGGHSKTIDRTFVPYRHDTHRFFGAAGYVGEENAQIKSVGVTVPFSRVWSLQAKFLSVAVLSPLHGLVFENGDTLDPVTFAPGRFAGIRARHAFNEYDAALMWKPHPQGMALTLAYAEVRAGQYIHAAVYNGTPFRIPPIQWGGVKLDAPIF